MRIGAVFVENPVFAAPMAGVTDKAYRILAKEAGCGLVYTEMVSDQALLYGNPKTLHILDLTGEASPVAVQIFGSNPEYLADAAEIAESRGAGIIDINMGCPTPKIVKNGEGAALMRDTARAAMIVRAVAGRVKVPVTVKMRKGWDENSINAVELAQIVVDAGAAAVAVHGRTRSQFYLGRADWGIIGAVKEAVPVPVIGNGDIWHPEDAARLMAASGCDAVMIGRGALGNPWLFSRTLSRLETGELPPEPGCGVKMETALRHLELLIRFKGEAMAVREMRKHAAWYIRGLRGAARLRDQINRAASRLEMEEILRRPLDHDGLTG